MSGAPLELGYTLRAPVNEAEARLARKISLFIGQQIDSGDTILDAMAAVDFRWPGLKFSVAHAAFQLEHARRERAGAGLQ